MGRSTSRRRVFAVPEVTYFKPGGVPHGTFDEICITFEEAEAVRLRDLEQLEQEQCARSMCVSRTTFARILESARLKIADALLHGKAIRIDGGSFEMAMRCFRCADGHEWQVPFDVLIAAPPRLCPECSTSNILPLRPRRSGRILASGGESPRYGAEGDRVAEEGKDEHTR